ncbi:MAG: nitrilase-related carbon-nitrogen hydrolase, partial [Desulfotomaculales bacterium]
MKKIRVALVQMRAETDRKKENLARIAAFARQAAKEGAEIVCFPELCVPGYNRERAGAAAEAIP